MNLKHIAIIPDGNGRWATKNNLPKAEGHKAGAENAMRIIEAAIKHGIKALTLWGFSSENWRRSEEEVNDLFSLMFHYLSSETEALCANGIKLQIIGNKEKLNPELREAIFAAEDLTKNNTKLCLYIAISYGGKDEITRACRNIVAQNLKPEQITEEVIAANLDAPDMLEVDLVIRTSGEKRLSNFLIWQMAYSELYFSNSLWPDFSETEFVEAMKDFDKRKRNFGHDRQLV